MNWVLVTHARLDTGRQQNGLMRIVLLYWHWIHLQLVLQELTPSFLLYLSCPLLIALTMASCTFVTWHFHSRYSKRLESSIVPHLGQNLLFLFILMIPSVDMVHSFSYIQICFQGKVSVLVIPLTLRRYEELLLIQSEFWRFDNIGRILNILMLLYHTDPILCYCLLPQEHMNIIN